ncbi:MAG: hypothetical protein KJO45_02370, partial [Sulfurovum sp.]|nr:hypothetical protein [Sulfurovum sp.]
MKKMITTSVAVAALLVTGTYANDLNDMFKDMKETAISLSKDAKDSVTTVKDGAVETTQSAERTVTNVSKDTKD